MAGMMRRFADWALGDYIEEKAAERAEAIAAEYVDDRRGWLQREVRELEELRVELALAGVDTVEELGDMRSFLLGEADSQAAIADENRGWFRTADGGASAGQLRRVQKQANYLFHRNPLARNIIRNYTFLTIGNGHEMRMPNKAAQRKWDEWAKANDWERRARRIVLNSFLYGEWPMILFPLSKDSDVKDDQGKNIDIRRLTRRQFAPVSKSRKPRREAVRGFNPQEITSVETEPDDADKLLYLCRTSGSRKYKYAEQDFLLPRVNFTGDDPRGRPVLEPVMRHVVWSHGFCYDRVSLNAMRARMPVVRKLLNISGTNAVQIEAAKHRRLPRPGSVLTVGSGEDWTFPSLNINSQGAVDDFRMLVLLIASGVNLPEFLVIMDASTANKASLQEAAEATRPMFDEFRGIFGDTFEDLSERVVGARGVVDWPSRERRETKDQVNAYSLAREDKVMSRRSYATRLGLDWDEELDQMEAKDAELTRRGLIDPVTPPSMFGFGNEDDEDDDDDAGGGAPPADDGEPVLDKDGKPLPPAMARQAKAPLPSKMAQNAQKLKDATKKG